MFLHALMGSYNMNFIYSNCKTAWLSDLNYSGALSAYQSAI